MTSFTPMNKNNLSNDLPLKIFNVDNTTNDNSFLKYMNLSKANKNESYQNIKKLSHSQIIDNITPKNTDWKNDIKYYEKEKKTLKWGKNPSVNHFTKFYINSQDRIFNPITQKYLDKTKEEKFKNKEKTDLINNISKGLDNELAISQTYDIINLQDKLKAFENDRNYLQSPRDTSF